MSQPSRSSAIASCDTGLGTSYERWALVQLLTRLQSQLGIASVLEGPGDGITGIQGINSLSFALAGAKVTVVLRQEACCDLALQVYTSHGCADRVTFHVSSTLNPPHCPPADLVWNFNVMPRQRDPNTVLDDMVQAAGRFVLVLVPNRANYAFWLHRLHHRVAHEEWDHGPPGLLTDKPWRRMMEEKRLVVRATILVDVPWWPDIVDPGQLIQDFFPFIPRWASKARSEKRYKWAADGLPYFDPESYGEFHQRMQRLSFLERSRWRWLKTRFSHHMGILAEKAWDV